MSDVLCGDCVELLPKFSDIDMILTDPPYGISNTRNSSGVSSAFSGYTSDKGSWDVQVPAEKWVPLACRALKPGGIFACFGTFGSLVSIFNVLEKEGMLFQSHITWHKTNPAPSIHRRMLTHANEIILVYSKGPKWYFDYQFSKELNGGKQHHNHFDVPAVRKYMGVTRKPVKLCEDLIRLFSPVGGIVLDPFAGSGSVPQAARDCNRRFIAIEIRQDCCTYMEEIFLKVGNEG